MYKEIVMVNPRHYFKEITYSINDFMVLGTPVDRKKARAQWNAFKNVLKSVGVESGHKPTIHVFDQRRGLPDSVFTANAFFVYKKRIAILSRFRKKERRREEPFFAAILNKLNFTIIELPEDAHFEGAGDAQYFFGPEGEKCLALGYGPRSDSKGVLCVSEIASAEADRFCFFGLREPWYHLDLCFKSVGPRALLYYPSAFEGTEQGTPKRFPHSIPVCEEDARNFVCNGVAFPDVSGERWHYIVNSRISSALERELVKRKIKVHKNGDLSEFNKAGGDGFCSVNFIG